MTLCAAKNQDGESCRYLRKDAGVDICVYPKHFASQFIKRSSIRKVHSAVFKPNAL